MTGVEIVKAIIEILVSGITELGQGIGAGLSSTVTAMFLSGTGEAQTLSSFGILIVVFGAISLSVGLTRLIYNFIVSLGGRK